ncbi:hypothetical protein BKA70DRAFT_1429896 [Coprinopsis sp. MPI-PUGE-AT-0042]|nr:hypothetical protein BKA70DRAFT_1429896 [Coprinopsis sp. MPI-PUGE-AT-0042]
MDHRKGALGVKPILALVSSSPLIILMRKAKRSADQKLDDAIIKIKDAGFTSPNHFIKEYYRSEHHTKQSLRLDEGRTYTPIDILDSWFKMAPSAEAKSALKAAVTSKASQFLVDESTAAITDKRLRVAIPTLTIALLTTGLLKRRIYHADLDCFQWRDDYDC